MPVDPNTGQWIPTNPAPAGGKFSGFDQLVPWLSGNLQAEKWQKPGIDWGALNSASKDQSSPFYGINFEGLPEDYTQKVSNYLKGVSGIKDPLYPQLLSDLGKAWGARDTVSANATRNSALDLRRSSAYNWDSTADAFAQNQAATGIDTENSGFAQKRLGEMAAQRDSGLQAAIMGKANEDALTNYNRRQDLINSSFGNMMNWLSMKKNRRFEKSGMASQFSMANQQSQIANQAGTTSALGSLLGGIGSYGMGSGG